MNGRLMSVQRKPSGVFEWCHGHSSHLFCLFCLIASAVKLHLVSSVPIYAIATAGHDDRLMINQTLSIMEGNWLGNYSEMTLVKGPFFPIFLAINHFFGIPYTLAVTGSYILACFLLVIALKPAIKNYFFLSLLFAALLFNPNTMSIQAFQRVYRNSITAIQVLMIFGGYFGILLRSSYSKRTLLPWVLYTGCGLLAFWTTREDSIWILPSVLMFTLLIGIRVISSNKPFRKAFLPKLIPAVSPVALLVLGLLVLSGINYFHYGIFTTNEISNSNFSKALSSLYSLKPEKEIPFVSVPRDTINQLYEYSPALESIRQPLEAALTNWEIHGKVSGDGEVEDGWFLWALRSAVADTGYYSSAERANTFYLTLHNEIEQAISSGKFSRRFLFPSAMLSPWRNEYKDQIVPTFLNALRYLISFNGIEVGQEKSISDGQDGIRLFESVTGNLAITSYPQIQLKGWYFLHDNDETVQLKIVSGNDLNEFQLPFSPSQDVHDFFSEQGIHYENAKNARFELRVDLVDQVDDQYNFVVTNPQTGEELERFSLERSNFEGHDEIRDYNIESFSLDKTGDPVFSQSTANIPRINKISWFYRKISARLFAAAFILYFFSFIVLIKYNRKDENQLFLTMLPAIILLGIFVLVLGITYTHISAFSAINPLYLSGGYPLVILFIMLSFYLFINQGMNFIMSKFKKNQSSSIQE